MLTINLCLTAVALFQNEGKSIDPFGGDCSRIKREDDIKKSASRQVIKTEKGGIERTTATGYEGDLEIVDSDEDISDDAFHMITQYNWEDDIIWNGDDLKHKVGHPFSPNYPIFAWRPTYRTVHRPTCSLSNTFNTLGSKELTISLFAFRNKWVNYFTICI